MMRTARRQAQIDGKTCKKKKIDSRLHREKSLKHVCSPNVDRPGRAPDMGFFGCHAVQPAQQ